MSRISTYPPYFGMNSLIKRLGKGWEWRTGDSGWGAHMVLLGREEKHYPNKSLWPPQQAKVMGAWPPHSPALPPTEIFWLRCLFIGTYRSILCKEMAWVPPVMVILYGMLALANTIATPSAKVPLRRAGDLCPSCSPLISSPQCCEGPSISSVHTSWVLRTSQKSLPSPCILDRRPSPFPVIPNRPFYSLILASRAKHRENVRTYSGLHVFLSSAHNVGMTEKAVCTQSCIESWTYIRLMNSHSNISVSTLYKQREWVLGRWFIGCRVAGENTDKVCPTPNNRASGSQT